MVWSLDDRTGPTRPLQVTCTLVVRWWVSSLRRSPPGCAGWRGRAGKAAPPVRVLRASTRTTEPKTPRRPGRGRNHHRTQHTRLGAQEEETTTTKRTTTTESPRRPRPGVLRALISLSSNASLLPVHCSAPLPAPAGSFEKRGVPSRPPSPRGGRENHSWPRSREIHSPKMRPLLHMTSDPNRPSPTPKRGKCRRERQAGKSCGKIRAPSELLWFPSSRSCNPWFLSPCRDGFT